MRLRQLLAHNLRYHWRGNLAAALGVMVGTAALTGALLVGDSLRGSLRALALRQLGWVEQALVGGRLLREELAAELDPSHVRPVLLLQGSANSVSESPQANDVRRAGGRVTIAGVLDGFWDGAVPKDVAFWNSGQEAVVLSAALAGELAVKPGDIIAFHVQKAAQVPRESLLGRRDATEVVDELRLTVAEILPPDHFGSQFTLTPNPAPPRNAFVPLHALQTRLGLSGRVNTLLASSGAGDLQGELPSRLTLDDWGLVLHDPAGRARALLTKLDRNGDGQLERNEWRGRLAESVARAIDANSDGILTSQEIADYYENARGYLSLESRQMLIEPAAAAAAQNVAGKVGLPSAPTLVYLANRIAHGKQSIPYSIIAALDPSLPAPLGLPGAVPLKDGEILLADWKESPLKPQPGDAIQVTYFVPEDQGQLRERTETLRFAGLVPMEGTAADPDLTPEFPGITDKLDVRDWNPPFPYDNKRIQKQDEDYWRQYRTTPKAYVTLATGQRLWGSRFGKLTSIRFASPGKADELRRALLNELSPAQGGLVFDDVRQRSLSASTGGTDFGGLFLGFSSFVILAALLLVGLLFRLNLDRRGAEIGLLFAVGYPLRTVRRLLLAEGLLMAALAGVIGCGLALAYAWLLLDLLAAWWPAAMDRSFLRLHVQGSSLAWGYVGSLIVGGLTIAWALRTLSRLSPSALVSGASTEMQGSVAERPPRWSTWLALLSGLLGLALVAWGSLDRRLAANHEMLASVFFSGGFLLLGAGLLGLWAWMKRRRTETATRAVRPASFWARPLLALGIRNATRYPLRSLLTAGLLASAAFLIVAVDSFRREPDAAFLEKNAGSGGFALVAESELPTYQDLNTEKGRDELNFSDAARKELQSTTIVQLRLRGGDDASCLNLYQPRRPRLLGVPRVLIDRGGFHFQATETGNDDERHNPWRLLESSPADGAIPVFGEANTVQWMLKSGLGQTLEVPNERGEPVKLRIVGLLEDSVFQSELLVSEAHFLQLYPSQEGYNYFLIDTPAAQAAAVKRTLENALAERGFVATPSLERLNQYLAVENTYLSTFQALGGLGLLLGALGCAVVLLRSVWERRGELALLRALGYRKSAIGWLIVAENGFLIATGLAVGTIAALLSVWPRLRDTAGGVSAGRLLAFLAVVLLVGVLAGVAAAVTALRAPLLPALRRE